MEIYFDVDIYVDESGDLGFSLGSSRFFVVSYLMTNNTAPIERVMKRFLGRSKTKKKFAGKELKFSNSSPDIREQVLIKLLNVDWTTGLIILEKAKVEPNLRKIPDVLYNYTILEFIMKDILSFYDNNSSINIHIDRSKDKSRADAFNIYAYDKASYIWQQVLKKKRPFNLGNLTVEHCYSHSNKCIQIADFIAGAAFQYYERENPTYLDIIKTRITKKTYLWRGSRV